MLVLLYLHLCFLPSIDVYKILGRHVHMDFVQEHLTVKKKINIGDSQASPNNIQLKILADTVYVKVRNKVWADVNKIK